MSLNDAEPRDSQTHAIIGAAMEVHRQLGPGFLETVYQEALEIELVARGVPFMPQLELPVFYKGHRLRCYYKADFVCYESVIVEVKAVKALSGVEESQILNYLKATGNQRGLLINFGAPSLQFNRFIWSNNQNADPQISLISPIRENETM